VTGTWLIWCIAMEWGKCEVTLIFTKLSRKIGLDCWETWLPFALQCYLLHALQRKLEQRSLGEVISATVINKEILPLIFYRPFKASKFYLQGKFPDLNIEDYTDKFWYAERYYNAFRLEEHSEKWFWVLLSLKVSLMLNALYIQYHSWLFTTCSFSFCFHRIKDSNKLSLRETDSLW